MRLIKKMLKQKCIYWAPIGPDQHGKRLFAEPVAVNCRWTDGEQEYMDEQGNVQLSRSRVFTEIDVEPLGVLWLSSKRASDSNEAALAEINQTNTRKPFLNKKAYEIRKFQKIPVLDAKKFVRISML